MTIKRYHCHPCLGSIAPDGKYVLFSDHEKEVTRLQSLCDSLCDDVKALLKKHVPHWRGGKPVVMDMEPDGAKIISSCSVCDGSLFWGTYKCYACRTVYVNPVYQE